jgi:hypothetical protein
MPGKGQWINKEGELFEERVIPVRISCDKKTIERIMDITAEHYKQYAVLAWKVSEEVLLKDYEPK